MPCLEEERFLLLEHSVTVRPQHDVDALVARIGQALQLEAPCSRPGHPTPPETGYGAGSSAVAACGCVRGRSAPYALCAARASGKQSQQHRAPLQGTAAPGKKQLCGRGWTRGAAARDRGDEEDPHRLLQELLLSGNLIKEAVRRLQLAASCTVPETVQ
ncbi:GSK-3-binding protein-like [Lissotriton helveticus]